MKITFLTYGTEGDTRPLLALAREVIHRGHEAHVLADVAGAPRAQALGIPFTALAGDMFIAHTTWRWMDLQRRHGGAPVYFYYFDQPRPAKVHPAAGESPDPGAVHSGEIEYALGNLAGNPVYAWTAADRAASAMMEGYFARFIKTGDPNGAGLPPWPAVRESDGGLLRQVIAAHCRTEADRGAARQAFLQAYFATHADPL